MKLQFLKNNFIFLIKFLIKFALSYMENLVKLFRCNIIILFHHCFHIEFFFESDFEKVFRCNISWLPYSITSFKQVGTDAPLTISETDFRHKKGNLSFFFNFTKITLISGGAGSGAFYVFFLVFICDLENNFTNFFFASFFLTTSAGHEGS